jgi:hypothetical protein
MSNDRKEQDRRFRILALYTEQHAGRERVTHVRLRECSTVREGFGENAIARRGLPGARTSGGSRDSAGRQIHKRGANSPTKR